MAGALRIELSRADAPVRVLQLTDTHLGELPGTELLGLDTDASLAAVAHQALAEAPPPDLLLGTGDLSDHGSAASYQRLRQVFDRFSAPWYWLPGNHDDRAVMSAVVGRERVCPELRIGCWHLILLDSQIPGEVGGQLGSGELQRLEEGLAEAARDGLWSLVCLHHQPVPVGCEWLDEQMVQDAAALFDILGRYPRARGLLWGHVHQSLDRSRGELRLMCTPSTCVQFLPGQRNFAVDTAAPGYRWLTLHPDGHMESRVSRVQGFQQAADRAAQGYR